MNSSTSGSSRPLLSLAGSVNEWRRSSAFYSRVTIHQHCNLRRPSGGFPISQKSGKAQSVAQGLACSSYLRRDYLDMGNVANAVEMGKLNLQVSEIENYVIFKMPN